ncbi:INMT [Branchiostoma lanceolatum]|uniref:INMT protein n=1 Tax=Branchiostoma lanceolatum TaxID=7740 RepID=A0A8J9ZKQ4_BRALA|nr:INMT [Branchiostoma lanceolatum]
MADPKTKPSEPGGEMSEARKMLNMFFGNFDGTDDRDCFQVFVMKNLHETFQSGVFQGRRLLDLGTGPSIMSLLSASKYFPEITCSDSSQVNRDELQKWLDGDPDVFDWTPYLQYASKLEGNSYTPDDIASRVRAAVKAVIPCDVTQSSPLSSRVDPFDIVGSFFHAEFACTTSDQYCAAVKNMTSLLKHGGGLIISGDFKNNPIAGKEDFSATFNADLLRETLASCGFTDVEVKLTSMIDQQVPCDFFFVTAIKK